MSVDFTVRLDDKTSGPAQKAAGGVDKLSNSLRKNSVAAEKASQTLEKANARLRDSQGRFRKTGDAAKKAIAAPKASTTLIGLGPAMKKTGQATITAAQAAARWSAVVGQQQRVAKAAAAALDESTRRTKVFDFTTGRAVNSVRRMNLALARQNKGLRASATSAMPKVSQGFSELGGSIASVLGPAALVAGAFVIVTKVLTAVARAALALGKTIVQAAVFLDGMETSLAALTGSSAKGSAALERVLKISAKLGLPVQETTKQFQKLLALQFTPKGAEDLIKLSADLRFIGASAEQTSSVLNTMGQILSKGRLQGEELLQLSEAGIAQKLVFEALAKATGKTTAEVQKLVAAGKINAKQGIAAIKAAVLAKTKTTELGQAAAKAGKTIAGSFNIVKAQGELLVLQLAKKILPTIRNQVGPAFEDFQKILTSPAATKALDVIASGLKVVARAAGLVLKMVGGLVEGLIKGLSGGADAAGKLEDSFELTPQQINEMVQGAIQFGQTIGEAVTQVLKLLAAITKLGKKLGGVEGTRAGGLMPGTPGDILAPLINAEEQAEKQMALIATSGGQTIGQSLTQGIAQGIVSGASSVVSAATTMAMGAIQAAKSALGISSPSKVFAEFGQQSATGFQQGITGQSGATTSASAGAVQPSEVLSSAAGAGVGGNRGGGSVSVNLNIEIVGGESATATAEAVKRMALDGLASAIEQIATEQGVLAGG